MENLRRACAEHPAVLIHLPTINGYNASPDELTATAALLAELPGGRFRVEPLWYHEYGKDKWLRAGKTMRWATALSPTGRSGRFSTRCMPAA